MRWWEEKGSQSTSYNGCTIITRTLYRKKSSARKDFAVSVNVAYEDVKSEAEKIEGEYENLDIILKSSGLCTDTDHEFKTATASTICTCEPADSGTDEVMCVTSRQQ